MSVSRLNLIVVAVVVVSTGAFVAGLLMPGLDELKDRRERFASETAQVEQRQREVGDLSGLYVSLQRSNKAMSGFREKLPTERRLGEFLNDLSRCLQESEITEYIIQPRQAIETDPAELPPGFELAAGTIVLPVSISFESSFELAFAFLTRLEALERLTHLESIEWLNDERHVGRVTTAIVLHTYHHPTIEN